MNLEFPVPQMPAWMPIPRPPISEYPSRNRTEERLRLLFPEEPVFLFGIQLAIVVRIRVIAAQETQRPPKIIDAIICSLRSPTHRFINRHRLRSEEHTSELQSQSNLVCR